MVFFCLMIYKNYSLDDTNIKKDNDENLGVNYMNQFEKKIAVLMIIKNCGDVGITQDEILKLIDFYSQPNLSMNLKLLVGCGYLTKEKTTKPGVGRYSYLFNYKLTEKAKFIFGAQ